MMSKRDKTFSRGDAEGAENMGFRLLWLLRVGHKTAHPCLPLFSALSASPRETLFGSGLSGLG
jgi:hypothetical protein